MAEDRVVELTQATTIEA